MNEFENATNLVFPSEVQGPREQANHFAAAIGDQQAKMLNAWAAAYWQFTGFGPDEVELVTEVRGDTVRLRFVPLTDREPECTSRSVDVLRAARKIIEEERKKCSAVCRTQWVLRDIADKLNRAAAKESAHLDKEIDPRT